MNRRERRAFDKMSIKEFNQIKQQTLKQLNKQYPDRNFTKEEIDEADKKVLEVIELHKLYAGKNNM
jgi:hypothetical protein